MWLPFFRRAIDEKRSEIKQNRNSNNKSAAHKKKPMTDLCLCARGDFLTCRVAINSILLYSKLSYT